ncbi:catalase [Egicoccus sp. AB-alg6-2]|uniref:catalase n=1 Tax=Egicoccus sp. AB-alg6-2 TaxID=3242692 RepID=UPI00359D5A55
MADDHTRTEKDRQLDEVRRDHDGAHLTTDQGVKVDHTDDSLKAGERGPTLIEDFHFREKLTHFDHERIPERIVHPRGSGAHGVFECYEDLHELTRAHVFGAAGRQTPVFVRFSTVVGFRGSADTVRDVRGFATKFYTEEGNWDLVGNNMPVFFIQDAIKFPDLVHSIKPEQHHQMPQASAAHDTFWDFASLTPESTHTLLWVTSPRGVPRSYRMMEGFGVHTFRFVNAAGEATFVKFHWRPLLGTHSLVWDETQKIAGKDPDFNRRDLWEAIEQGNHPVWELAVQLVPQADEHAFDFDLLDPTKIIPEEEVPLRPIGKMTLNRNPDNFFAETEQVAFHPGNVVPGIDFTNDPLLQGRLFSYLDTQLIRLGGPNFAQIPINRPVAEVHHHQREGYGQHRIDRGRGSYFPSSLGGAEVATPEQGAYHHYEERVEGAKIRARSDSFDDHYSQATLFWNSMSDWEQQHIIDAFRFELGKVDTMHVRERMVDNLNHVDHRLAVEVAEGIGVAPPERPATDNHGRRSPALSQASQPSSVATRKVAVLAADGVDRSSLQPVLDHLAGAGATCEIVAPTDGSLRCAGDGEPLPVDRAMNTMASVLYDAVLVAGGDDSVEGVRSKGELANWPLEAFKHAKPIAAIGSGVALLHELSLPGVELAGAEGGFVDDAGVVTLVGGGADELSTFASAFADAIAAHRHFDRPLALVRA